MKNDFTNKFPLIFIAKLFSSFFGPEIAIVHWVKIETFDQGYFKWKQHV